MTGSQLTRVAPDAESDSAKEAHGLQAMSPKHHAYLPFIRPNDMIYTDKNKEPIAGEIVLVKLNDGNDHMATLEAIGKKQTLFTFFHEPFRPVAVRKTDIVSLHKVVMVAYT